MQFDGQQYGVPTDLSLHFLLRQDLIDQLLSDDAWKAKYTEIAKEKMGKDLAPKDPDQWTWDLEATAYFFTKAINPDSPTRYGAVLQMKNLLFNMMVWHSTARSNGGNWMDAEGNITVDSPAYRTALELYKRLYDAGVTPKDRPPTNMPRPTPPSVGPGGDHASVEGGVRRPRQRREDPGGRGQDRHRRACLPAGWPLHPYPSARPRHQQDLAEQGRRQEVHTWLATPEAIEPTPRPAARRQ